MHVFQIKFATMFPNLEKRFSRNWFNVALIFFPFDLLTTDGYTSLYYDLCHYNFLHWGSGCPKIASKYNSNTILNFLR